MMFMWTIYYAIIAWPKINFLELFLPYEAFFGPVLSFCRLGYAGERQYVEVLDVMVVLT